MKKAHMAHVMFFVKDVDVMAAFYENALDMAHEPSSDPGWRVLTSPSAAGIALHALPAAIADTIELSVPPRFREDTFCKVCFRVGDLAAQRQRVLDSGGQAKEPWEFENTRFCECADPEGNVFQIFQRLDG